MSSTVNNCCVIASLQAVEQDVGSKMSSRPLQARAKLTHSDAGDETGNH